MPKPWAKLEVGFLDHPKFLALSANAICLWIEAKDYCEKHLTDGLIPSAALKRFRFRGAKSVSQLTTPCGLKVDGTPYAPLWETHAVGFKMHDYLDYNDSREVVLARIEKADSDREENRERVRRWREQKRKEESEKRHCNKGVTHYKDVRERSIEKNSTEKNISLRESAEPFNDESSEPEGPDGQAMWLQLLAEYPEDRITESRETEDAFIEALGLPQEREERFALMLETLRRHKASDQWNNPRFIPNLMTWLKRGDWRGRRKLSPAATATGTEQRSNVPDAEATRRMPYANFEFGVGPR